MEENRLDIVLGDGNEKRVISIDIPPFTLIGATTIIGNLSDPFLSRFGIELIMDDYNDKESVLIIDNELNKYGFEICDDGKLLVAKISKNNPRMIIKNLKRIRDFNNQKLLDKKELIVILDKMGYSEMGLKKIEVLILNTIHQSVGEKWIGLNTLSKIIEVDRKTIENIYEPNLFRMGYIEKSTQGRRITKKGMRFIKE